MTTHKKLIAAAVAVVALAVPAIASATGEHASTAGFPPGYLQINPVTCRFLHPEIDQPTGPTWKNLRKFAIWEDARHDAKLNCLTNRPDHTGGLAGYVQVKATSTGSERDGDLPDGRRRAGRGHQKRRSPPAPTHPAPRHGRSTAPTTTTWRRSPSSPPARRRLVHRRR